MFKGLGVKFTVLITVLIVAIMLLLGAVIFLVQRDILNENLKNSQANLVESLRNRGRSMVYFLAKIAPESILTYDYAMLDHYVSEISKEADFEEGIFYNDKGVALTKTTVTPHGEDSDILELTEPVIFHGKKLGLVEIHLSQERIHGIIKAEKNKIEKSLEKLFSALIMVFLVGVVLLVCVIGVVFRKIIILPLSRVRDALQDITRGDLGFTRRIERVTQDEIGGLADSFNKMAANLQERDEEIKRSNQQLRANEQQLKAAIVKAEAAAQAKGNFLANMSHEIRTPMNSILGFSDMLSRTSLDEKQKSYLSSVTASGELLLDIINSILDISKLGSSVLVLESIDFDLEYLVSDVFKMLMPKFSEKGLVTYIDIDKHIRRFLKGDPTRLRQILVNLLSNAIKFTDKGDVGIIVRRDHEQSTEEDIVLLFSVRDTGIGIPKDKTGHIFGSFCQGDETTTRRYGGAGLGLSICKTLVEAMGGKIWLASEEGKGSAFFFTSHFKKGSPVSRKMIYPLSKKDLENKNVIIIDDNQHSREILQRYCEEFGMKVLSVMDSSLSAFQRIDQIVAEGGKPDLILSDIMMPGMDGYALVVKIRNSSHWGSIKVIAVTSDIRIGSAKDAYDHGFNGFLTKPVLRSDLFNIIVTVLGDQRPAPEQIITHHMAQELTCKGIRILVVEDNVLNQKLIEAMLEPLGCVGDYVSNGQEAIEKLGSNAAQYGLCLMDIQMPVMGGVEATKIIREKISRDLPIIALTAAVMEEDRKMAEEAGMNDFLTKPMRASDLRDMIFKYGKPEAHGTPSSGGVPASGEDAQEPQAAQKQGERTIKVLVVDDAAANRDLIKAYLDTFAFEGDYAANGQEALEKLRAHSYDICLLDLQMSGMDGLEVAQIIRSEISRDLPVIGITGVMEFDRETCLRSGMNDYMHKPVDMLKLKELILKYVTV
ncbi:MAG: response regulator [Candidatus Omnitrophota bacterium]